MVKGTNKNNLSKCLNNFSYNDLKYTMFLYIFSSNFLNFYFSIKQSDN